MVYKATVAVCSESHQKYIPAMRKHAEFVMLNLSVRKVTGRLYQVNIILGNTVARGQHNARCYRHCQDMKRSKEIGAEFFARTYCEHFPSPPYKRICVFRMILGTKSWHFRNGLADVVGKQYAFYASRTAYQCLGLRQFRWTVDTNTTPNQTLTAARSTHFVSVNSFMLLCLYLVAWCPRRYRLIGMTRRM
jgi:hypothetical protein